MSRKLVFPKYVSVGKVLVKEKAGKEETGWKYFCEAVGEITIPEKYEIKLVCGGLAPDDLDLYFLAYMGQDDLNEIEIECLEGINDFILDCNHLKFICTFTNLNQIVLHLPYEPSIVELMQAEKKIKEFNQNVSLSYCITINPERNV